MGFDLSKLKCPERSEYNTYEEFREANRRYTLAIDSVVYGFKLDENYNII